MKKTIVSMAILILISAGAYAQAPNTIMYQGRLTDNAGTPIVAPDSILVSFAILSDSEPGAPDSVFYVQASYVHPDQNGIFTVELGPVTNELAFIGGQRWLGMAIDSEEMLPRQLLTSVPYARSAGNGPIAVATINGATSAIYSGFGIASCTFNDSYNRYEIELIGESYYYTDFTTLITCSGHPYLVRTGSVGTSLLIYFYNASSLETVQNSYQFQIAIYKNPPMDKATARPEVPEGVDESTYIDGTE